MKEMAYREIQINRGTNVERIEYDDAAGTLRVYFQRPGSPVYTFYSVPGTVADGFTNSGATAGVYFNGNIKNQYPFDKG